MQLLKIIVDVIFFVSLIVPLFVAGLVIYAIKEIYGIKRKKVQVGMLGYGEIGSAVSSFYTNSWRKRVKYNLLIKDLERNQFSSTLDILNVCIPYTNNFVKIVEKNIKTYDPKMIIIHSTVKMGTTSELKKIFPDKIIVHSPVKGVHPDLVKGIKVFTKFIGADLFFNDGIAVKEHFLDIGINNTRVVFRSRNTEVMKLFSTLTYGINIAIEKEVHKFCEDNKLDFETVYSEANKDYNRGYKKLQCPEYCKYELIHCPGEIYGHCVIPNAKLLDCDLSKFLLKKNEEYKKNK